MFLDTREAFVGNFTKSTLVRLVDGRWQLLLRFLLLGFGLSGKLHLRDLQSCDYDKHWKNFKSKKLLYDVIRLDQPVLANVNGATYCGSLVKWPFEIA